MKYFYIICRDGQMFEMPFTEENYQTTAQEIINKGLMAIKPKGHTNHVILNSVDVIKILDESNYDNYVDSVRPNLYIKNGVWRDGKERQIVKYENWKQKQIDDRERLDEIWKDEKLTVAQKNELSLQIENNIKLI